MFKPKRVKHEEPANLILDQLSSIIVSSDIKAIDETYEPKINRHANRKEGLDTTAVFFTELQKLLTFNITTHDDTKKRIASPSMGTTHNYLPLCFLAARYDRRNIFQLLLNAFGEDIHLLQDGYLKGNILHHLYNEHSLASLAMINDVFECLARHCSSEQILTLINALDKDECTVVMQSKIREIGELEGHRPITDDLYRRITRLTATVPTPELTSEVSIKEASKATEATGVSIQPVGGYSPTMFAQTTFPSTQSKMAIIAVAKHSFTQ